MAQSQLIQSLVLDGNAESGTVSNIQLLPNNDIGSTVMAINGQAHSGPYCFLLNKLFAMDKVGYNYKALPVAPGSAYSVTVWLMADKPSYANEFVQITWGSAVDGNGFITTPVGSVINLPLNFPIKLYWAQHGVGQVYTAPAGATYMQIGVLCEDALNVWVDDVVVLPTTEVEVAGTVLAGPPSGQPATPTFRRLTAGDFPTNLPYLPLSGGAITGNLTVSGTLGVGGNVTFNGNLQVAGAGILYPGTGGISWPGNTFTDFATSTTRSWNGVSSTLMSLDASGNLTTSGSINATGPISAGGTLSGADIAISASKPARQVWAAPVGSPGVPSFRLLATTDLPALASTNLSDTTNQTAFTPTFSFTTPGDLAVTYTSQSGNFYKIGRLVFINLVLTVASITYTTAAGNPVIGFPAPCPDANNANMLLPVTTINVPWSVGGANSQLYVRSSVSHGFVPQVMGSNGSVTSLGTADFPTGKANFTFVITGVFYT